LGGGIGSIVEHPQIEIIKQSKIGIRMSVITPKCLKDDLSAGTRIPPSNKEVAKKFATAAVVNVWFMVVSSLL
jgi:hypothetical protein